MENGEDSCYYLLRDDKPCQSACTSGCNVQCKYYRPKGIDATAHNSEKYEPYEERLMKRIFT